MGLKLCPSEPLLCSSVFSWVCKPQTVLSQWKCCWVLGSHYSHCSKPELLHQHLSMFFRSCFGSVENELLDPSKGCRQCWEGHCLQMHLAVEVENTLCITNCNIILQDIFWKKFVKSILLYSVVLFLSLRKKKRLFILCYEVQDVCRSSWIVGGVLFSLPCLVAFGIVFGVEVVVFWVLLLFRDLGFVIFWEDYAETTFWIPLTA